MNLDIAAVRKDIWEIVYASTVETGMTLFGRKDGQTLEIMYVCGPGQKAIHQVAHYEPDHDHVDDFYNDLLKRDPAIQHLGEFHVHPFGMRRLSGGDRTTVHEVLKVYEHFLAGVILRRRGGLEIYPVYFTRESEEELERIYVPRRNESKANTFRRYWRGIWRKRFGRHAVEVESK